MQRTISVMVGKGSVNHNSRKFHAANTDPERASLNLSYCNVDIKQAYHQLFADAVQRYNEKQTRADRVIKDYYTKIRSGKQEKPFHEIILQIGDRDNMAAESRNGVLAQTVLDEYYEGFQKRNPNLHVFSAHLHMDEATPHLHIDFVPFTTGSKRGLDTRVSLKQALAAQGFKGGSRQETEWNQWVSSEKQQLAAAMERHGIQWEQKGTHKKHLSVLEYEKEMRSQELERLCGEVDAKSEEVTALSNRINNLLECENAVVKISERFETDPEFQLPEPQGLMSAKSYKTKSVEPLFVKLKSLIKSMMVRYFKVKDDYSRLNQANGRLYQNNEVLRLQNEKLHETNTLLKEDVKEYRLLRKAFGNTQIDSLLKQAKQTKQRDTRSKYER